MQVTMHVVLDNLHELAQFSEILSKVNGSKAASVAPAVSSVKTDKKQTFEDKMKAKAEATVEPAAEPAPKDEKSPSPLDPTYNNMKSAVLLVSKTKGRSVAETILKKYGANKIGPDVEEKHFANIISDCNTALA